MTSIFCPSLLQASSGAVFNLQILLLSPIFLLFKFRTSSKISKNLQGLLFYLLAVVVPVGLAFKSVCYYISSFCFSVSFQKRGLRLLFFINSSPSSLHFGGAREFRSSRESERKTGRNWKNEDHEDKTSSLSPNHFSGLIFPNLISLSLGPHSLWDWEM